MPISQPIAVKRLRLDLNNFRTVPQKDEEGAIRAMISIHPEWFWALTESVLDTGYLPTENIIVLRDGLNGQMTVKEGNRRLAAIKLVFGLLSEEGLFIPTHIKDKMTAISAQWKKDNKEVPCTIYDLTESALVDRIVTLTHGKAQQAGRDQWPAVARARHNRLNNPAAEPALDLLEGYLRVVRDISADQKDRWSGDYPLTVLDEAMRRNARRFGVESPRELATKYPKVKNKQALELIIRDVGLETLGFKELRDASKDVLVSKYGLPVAATPATSGDATRSGASTDAASASATAGSTTSRKAKATAANDPKSVAQALKALNPKGPNRHKVVSLLNEARKLKIGVTPIAFCFVLRSMFELSAKAYCMDHATDGLSATKAGGGDKDLVEVLREITGFLTRGPDGKPDRALVRLYHGAMAELAKPSGFLSVTSLNQLVHNPKFMVDDTHLSTLFGNIFPLLEAMNS